MGEVGEVGERFIKAAAFQVVAQLGIYRSRQGEGERADAFRNHLQRGQMSGGIPRVPGSVCYDLESFLQSRDKRRFRRHLHWNVRRRKRLIPRGAQQGLIDGISFGAQLTFGFKPVMPRVSLLTEHTAVFSDEISPQFNGLMGYMNREQLGGV